MVSAQNAHDNGAFSKNVATKLISVDSALADQEAQLVARLAAIQEKRQSLKTVIQIFDGFSLPTSPSQKVEHVGLPTSNGHVTEQEVHVEEPVVSHSSELTVAEEIEEPAASHGNEPITAEEQVQEENPPVQEKPKAKRGRKPGKARVSRQNGKVATRSRKKPTDNESIAPWQSFVKDDYQSVSLPKAVLNVLQQQPDQVVELSTIVDEIFVDDIPQPARMIARDRLSNVLSIGLKNNKWYRGKTGYYSVSKEAADASSTF